MVANCCTVFIHYILHVVVHIGLPSSKLGEDEGAVCASKPKAVREGHINLLLLRLVRHKVEINADIWFV